MPVPVSAHDVADELRTRFPDLGLVKLHKLLYYVQGWHLASRGQPLFREEIRAWSNGPVVAELWANEKHERPRPASQPLGDEHSATIDYVVNRYGHLTGNELIRLTHAEDPWRNVSESDAGFTVMDPVIELESMRHWFASREDHLAHLATLEKLRARTDVYGFGPLEITPDLEEHLRDAMTGVQIVETRPT